MRQRTMKFPRAAKSSRRYLPTNFRRLDFEEYEPRLMLTLQLPELVSASDTATATADTASSSAGRQVISDDGRYEVFTSSATNLVAGISDTNSTTDVLLRDLQSGSTTLISANPSGDAANGRSDQPVISADGDSIAFRSVATDLGTADSNSIADIFLWRRATNSITLLTANAAGDNGGNGASESPSISGDGSVVAFQSQATDLVEGTTDDNFATDVFLYDMSASSISLISSDPATTATGNGRSFDAIVSKDASTVVFASDASNLVADVLDINLTTDIFAYNVATEVTEVVSIEQSGNASGNFGSESGDRQTTSDDGRFHVFASAANNLDADVIDDNFASDIFLFDALTKETSLITVNASGEVANASSLQPVISGDGNFVAFTTFATNLGTPKIFSFRRDVLRWERATGEFLLISQNAAGDNGGNSSSDNPSISGDGSIVAFESLATNLVPGIVDASNTPDIFYHDVGTGITTLVSSNRTETGTANGDSTGPVLSQDGSAIAFESWASDLVSGAVDLGGRDIYLYDIDAQQKEPITQPMSGNTAGDLGSFVARRQVTSDDGRYHVFASDATDLDGDVAFDLNETTDVFLFDNLTGRTTMVSRNSDGDAANNRSDQPVISGDGNWVAFRSRATDLDETDHDNLNDDIFLWHRRTANVQLVSLNADEDNGGNHSSSNPSISRQGLVAFESLATDLVTGITDTNGAADIFVGDGFSPPDLASVNRLASATGDAGSFNPIISDDLTSVFFESSATDLDSSVADTPGNDLFVRHLRGSQANTTQTVTVTAAVPPVSSGGFVSNSADVSDSGSIVAFADDADTLDSLDNNSQRDVFVRDLSQETAALISVNDAGSAAGNGASDQPRISGNGFHVVFRSDADDLAPPDSDAQADIFVRNRLTSTTALASVNLAGDGSGNAPSKDPSISSDGRYVSFLSGATNLVAAAVGGAQDNVFVRDTTAGQSALVSINREETGEANGTSEAPLLTSNGARITFHTTATDLDFRVVDRNGAERDVYSYVINTVDLLLGGSELVSKKSPANPLGGNSQGPDISDDGQVVAFFSLIDLTNDDAPFTTDVFVRDRGSQSFEAISVADNDGSPGSSVLPRISGDGNTVVFQSVGPLTASDVNGLSDIYARDRANATTTLISRNHSQSSGGNARSAIARVSDDGRFVAFQSPATDLVANGTQAGQENVFLHDILNNQTILVSSDSSGVMEADGPSSTPFISANGARVVFSTTGTDLLNSDFADLNAASLDVYSHAVNAANISLGTKELVSRRAAGFEQTGYLVSGFFRATSINPDVSDDGQIVTFQSSAAALSDPPTPFSSNVFARDRATGITSLVSINLAGTGHGNRGGSNARISGNGEIVVFESNSDDIIGGDTNGTTDVFAWLRAEKRNEFISLDASGRFSANSSSTGARVSDDGRVVTFVSRGTDLVAEGVVSSSQQNVYLRDREEDTTELVSRNSTGLEDGNGRSFEADISGNAMTVVFHSDATDLVAGIDDANSATDLFAARAEIVVTTLVVENVLPRAFGVEVQFNRDIDPTGLNLYDVESGVHGLPDVTVVGASVGAVPGSLVVRTRGFVFVAAAGPLAADSYTLRIRSGADAFRELVGGGPLDGDGDGTADDDFVGEFTIDAHPAVAIQIPDFTRGPGQDVDVPANADGIPLRVDGGTGIESIQVTLTYDDSLLDISAVELGADAPAGASLSVSTNLPGQFAFTFATPTPSTPDATEFARLVAAVPASASYGDAHLIESAVVVNDGAISAIADSAVHTAAFFGDTTRNRGYSSLDAQRVARVVVLLDTGFQAFPLIAPVIIADITQNGALSALDAQRIAQEVVGLDPFEIPPLPAGASGSSQPISSGVEMLQQVIVRDRFGAPIYLSGNRAELGQRRGDDFRRAGNASPLPSVLSVADELFRRLSSTTLEDFLGAKDSDLHNELASSLTKSGTGEP